MRRARTALLGVALGGGAAAAPGEHGRDLAMLREEARVAMRACRTCHDAARSTALPGALRAFDLDRVEWASALDPSKLGCMEQRFGDLKVPEAERRRVEAYLDAEWTWRAAAPPLDARERSP